MNLAAARPINKWPAQNRQGLPQAHGRGRNTSPLASLPMRVRCLAANAVVDDTRSAINPAAEFDLSLALSISSAQKSGPIRTKALGVFRERAGH